MLSYKKYLLYNWFSRSALRNKKYLKIYCTIYGGDESPKIIFLSRTRWLAKGKYVKRILDQWDFLKLHIQIFVNLG